MINISNPIIGEEEIEAVKAVLKSGVLAQGPRVKELEENFAKYCGAKHAIAVNNGTAAIHAGLYALGVHRDDEVITTPFTFVASANPILMMGAKVVFADIGEDDFCLSSDALFDKINEKTKAILPVNLYGQIYDFDKLTDVIGNRDIKILEDACQSVGAEIKGVRSGNFGDIAAFSFYATKNIMCGEGGMVVTNNAEMAEQCRRFRHHGQSELTKYEYLDLGYNYRLTDLQAAIALVQLKKADDLNGKRIKNAKLLSEGLFGVKGLVLPKVKENYIHVFHQYTIRITEDFVSSRENLMNHLKSQEIGCGIYYPKPLHLHPHFRKMGYKEGDFPVAERMASEVLSLPVHPNVSEEGINKIIRVIKEYASK